MATKISVINFKGGVGKTTFAFHFATYLAKTSKVLVIDVDHQSSLSIVFLGPKWEGQVKAGKTCNIIFESFCKRNVMMPGIEIIVENPLHLRQPDYDFYPRLDLVPAQFELDDTEIEMASTTMGGPTVSEWDKRTLMAAWLDAINADNVYDYIIFDCPPATKIVSQNALAASDYYVIPVIPDELSTRGVTHFRNLVSEKVDKKLEFLRNAAGISAGATPKTYVPTTRLAGIIPYMAKTSGNAKSGLTNIHTQQLVALKRLWKGDLIETVVKHMTGIPESMNAGWPVWNFQGGNVSKAVIKMLTDCCEEIKNRTV